MRYPAIVVAMEVQLFLAPRLLKDRHHGLSYTLHPTRSVVAGSARGTSLAKVYMHQVLQRAHEAVPTCGLWTFVDDTTARLEGSRRAVVEGLRDLSQIFEQGFVEERGLTISTKTTVLASDAELAEELRSSLATPAMPVTKALKAVDLGCGTAVGRQRACRKTAARFRAGRLRTAKIRRVRQRAALTMEAKGLWASGALPQAAYGAQVMGLAPWRVQELRRQAAATAAGRAGGRCLTTLLATTVGDDPGVAMRLEVLKSWLVLWETAPELHARIQRAWGRIRQALVAAKGYRWRRVRGPLGAVQAVLMDMGWEPASATCWIRPEHDGDWRQQATRAEGANYTEWFLVQSDSEDFGSYVDHLPILHDAKEDLQHQYWRKAALHEDGGGLAGGADPSLIAREQRRFAKHNRWCDWGSTPRSSVAASGLASAGGQRATALGRPAPAARPRQSRWLTASGSAQTIQRNCSNSNSRTR